MPIWGLTCKSIKKLCQNEADTAIINCNDTLPIRVFNCTPYDISYPIIILMISIFDLNGLCVQCVANIQAVALICSAVQMMKMKLFSPRDDCKREIGHSGV